MGFTFATIQYTIRALKDSSMRRNMDMKMFLQVKGYSRWSHRRPAKVINENEFFEDTDERSASKNILKNAKFAFAQRHQTLSKEMAKKDFELENQNDKGTLNDDGAPIFTKLQKDDPKITSLMLIVKSRKKQKQDDRILLEGYRLIEDAMKVGLVPEIVIFSRKPDLDRLPLPKEGVKLYKIPYQTIQLWSDLTTSPGIMGIFRTPDISKREPANDSIPVTIICDNIREPGNLGSILRVAAGVGCERVILTKGCVDLWSPKVLRSAAGAHFRLPIFKSLEWPEVQYLISENANILVADNNVKPPGELSESSELRESDSSSSSDSENSDSEPEAREKKEEKVLEGTGVDSWEKTSDKDSGISKSEERRGVSRSMKISLADRRRAFKEAVDSLPIIPYFSVQYTDTETIVIVGGETEGLSPESLALASRRQGLRINVPLTNGVDSLNTGTALGVVLFEIKRQFLIRLSNI